MYVAMTRARNHLSVTYPLNSYSTRRGADYSIDQLSRFIDRGMRDRMERVTVGVPERMDDKPAPDAAPLLDLRALLRGRFGA
jgi:DNA helicase-2/ATP-dependent DNA helicase PcrA